MNTAPANDFAAGFAGESQGAAIADALS